jgi:hypothetical protein
MRKTILRLVAAAGLTILFTGAITQGAHAAGDGNPALFSVGDHIYYADGTVEIDVPVGTFSLGECDSGQFCVWNQANYTGPLRYKTGSGAKALGGTVGSFWNDRSAAARLYSNTGKSSTCYAAGAKKASVTSGYSSASQVTLLAGSC